VPRNDREWLEKAVVDFEQTGDLNDLKIFVLQSRTPEEAAPLVELLLERDVKGADFLLSLINFTFESFCVSPELVTDLLLKLPQDSAIAGRFIQSFGLYLLTLDDERLVPRFEHHWASNKNRSWAWEVTVYTHRAHHKGQPVSSVGRAAILSCVRELTTPEGNWPPAMQVIAKMPCFEVQNIDDFVEESVALAASGDESDLNEAAFRTLWLLARPSGVDAAHAQTAVLRRPELASIGGVSNVLEWRRRDEEDRMLAAAPDAVGSALMVSRDRSQFAKTFADELLSASQPEVLQVLEREESNLKVTQPALAQAFSVHSGRDASGELNLQFLRRLGERYLSEAVLDKEFIQGLSEGGVSPRTVGISPEQGAQILLGHLERSWQEYAEKTGKATLSEVRWLVSESDGRLNHQRLAAVTAAIEGWSSHQPAKSLTLDVLSALSRSTELPVEN
jgi:hypothetical protein